MIDNAPRDRHELSRVQEVITDDDVFVTRLTSKTNFVAMFFPKTKQNSKLGLPGAQDDGRSSKNSLEWVLMHKTNYNT